MYELNDTPFPFWGAETTTKGGRDPLAVQNSSVVIYSNMITGITNVTARVRYNGFFCWLLTLIAKKLEKIDITKIDSPSEQIKYIRRGELLLAYIMIHCYHDVNGVSGSIFAQKKYSGNVLDLAKGADYENHPKVYWQNSLGIFGQYYIGVLSQLQLLYVPDASHKSYRPTKEGIRLGEIFSQSFSPEIETLFWESIYKGSISKEKLTSMGSMALHLINNENELNEYQRIFSKPDRKDIMGKDVCHRINSIKLLLNYIKTEGGKVTTKDCVLSFLRYNLETVVSLNYKATEEQLSWFMYELNELAHAAYEAFHFAILYSITEEPLPLDYVLDKLEKEFVTYSKDCDNESNMYSIYDKIKQRYKDKNYGGLIYEGSRLLACLYFEIEPHISELMEIAQHENYDVRNLGFAPSLLLRLMNGYKKKCDWDFAEYCIYYAINDHLRSSYSKSTIGQGLVHNYMVEDELIWKLRNPDPTRTSPRLQNTLQYIEDIKWIEVKGNHYSITARGLNILNND